MNFISLFYRLAVLSFFAFQAAFSAGALEPSSVVDKLHLSLLETMKKADQLGYSGRYRNLDPVVRSVFDFPSIAQIVVGRYWKDFSEGQRTSFVETFTKLSVATYASRFDDYSNEEFRQVAEDKLKEERVLIKTELKKSNGEVVQLNYVLQPKGNQWKIVNVIANGVSDLSLKRADYTAVLRDKGYDALMAMLNEKIAHYTKPGGNQT